MSTIIATRSKLIDLDNIRSTDIDIEDIAHSLSQQCRFNGNTKHFYSVAQHSINLYRLIAHLVKDGKLGDSHLPLYALLHDAHEAFVGDVCRPLQKRTDFTSYIVSIDMAIEDALKFRMHGKDIDVYDMMLGNWEGSKLLKPSYFWIYEVRTCKTIHPVEAELFEDAVVRLGLETDYTTPKDVAGLFVSTFKNAYRQFLEENSVADTE